MFTGKSCGVRIGVEKGWQQHKLAVDRSREEQWTQRLTVMVQELLIEGILMPLEVDPHLVART